MAHRLSKVKVDVTVFRQITLNNFDSLQKKRLCIVAEPKPFLVTVRMRYLLLPGSFTFAGDLLRGLLTDDLTFLDGVGGAFAVGEGAGEVEVHVTVFEVPDAVCVLGHTGEVGVDHAFFDESPAAGRRLDDFAVFLAVLIEQFVDIRWFVPRACSFFPGRDLIPVPAPVLREFGIAGQCHDTADEESDGQQEPKGPDDDREPDRLREGLFIRLPAMRAGVDIVREGRVTVAADPFPGRVGTGAASYRFDPVDLILQDDRPDDVEAENGEDESDDGVIVEHLKGLPEVRQFLRRLVEPVQFIVWDEHNEQQLDQRALLCRIPVAIRVFCGLKYPVKEVNAEGTDHEHDKAHEVSHVLRFFSLSARIDRVVGFVTVSCRCH